VTISVEIRDRVTRRFGGEAEVIRSYVADVQEPPTGE
jgi:hypothetical protein